MWEQTWRSSGWGCCVISSLSGRSCGWGTILNALRVALRINSGIRFFIRDSEKPAGFSESPFHGRGRGGKRHLQFRPLFNHCSPSVKIAFGALRRARQTRNKNILSAEYVQSAAEAIFNRPALPSGAFCALPKNPGKKQAHLPLTNAAALL